jgi:hypothetical protein
MLLWRRIRRRVPDRFRRLQNRCKQVDKIFKAVLGNIAILKPAVLISAAAI